MRKLTTLSILFAAPIALIFAVAGDNLLAPGASADSLAGPEDREVVSAAPIEGYKSLHDFATGDAAAPTPRRVVGEVGGEGAPGFGWRPSRGATRSAAEIERRPWAGTLTAKVWADLDAFEQWRGLVAGGPEAGVGARVARVWSLPTTDRISIEVRDSAGDAVVDAPVELWLGHGAIAWARTDNLGRVSFFPSFARGRGAQRSRTAFRVSVHHQGAVFTRPVRSGESLRLSLAARALSPPAVGDVMVVMDTTGSMNDELRYFQSELENVIARADAQLAQSVAMRISLNFYRDEGDAYVVRSFPFTRRLTEATQVLLQQRAGGGGDYPEAVDLALASAIEDHGWLESARGRILFLVLDAPPHSRKTNLRSIRRSLIAAARKGIRIFPVAGSGVDKETEFLLRHFAVLTGGSYVYLTDDSGVGGHHVEATGGRAQTERLDDALTRLIVESLREEDAPRPVYQARR